MKSSATLTALAAALLWASPAISATPSAGVEQKIRSGFFADINMGGFSTVGGTATVSNMQAYLQLGIGYDVVPSFALGLVFGIGASGASCFSELDRKGNCVATGGSATTAVADNFTATLMALEGSYRVAVNERFSVIPRLRVGYTMLDPAPLYVNGDPNKPVTGAPSAGLALGVEYATHMDHFSIGLDLYGGVFIGPNIGSFAVYPKIKYTF